MGSQCRMYIIICLLLVSPTYGESGSEQLEILRMEMKEMRLERQQEKEEMRVKLEEVRAQREEEKSYLIVKLNEMTKKVDRLEETLPPLPSVVSCAYKHYWSKAGSVITYDSHVVEGEGEGGIDLDTGRFNVGKGGAGYYTVTYSGYTELDSGKRVNVYLYRNGKSMGAYGEWLSYNGNSERVHDQGSRTLILHLDEQDYLELRTHWIYSNGDLFELTFCASLAPLPYDE